MLDAEIDRAVAGDEIDSPELRPWIEMEAHEHPDGNSWLIRGFSDVKDDEIRRQIEKLPIDWQTESLVLAAPFAVEGSRRFAIRESTLEIHVGKAVVCLEPEQNPDLLYSATPTGWYALRVPRTVDDVRIIEHVTSFRVPVLETAGTCAIRTTNQSNDRWHAAIQEEVGYRMWIQRGRDDCSNPGTYKCSDVFVSESADGTSWTPARQGEGIRAEFDEGAPSPLDWFQAPAVLRIEGGGYLMFHFSRAELHASLSDDGVRWVGEGKVLDPMRSPSGAYLSTRNIGALRHAGGFWVWVEALDDDDSIPRIYLVRSEDGRSWVRVGDGPVMREGPPGSFDELGVGAPQVFREDGRFVMVYTGRYGGDNTSRPLYSVLAIAESDDGIHWVKRDRPLPVPNDESVYARIESPSIVRAGDRLFVWYADGSGRIWQADCGW